MSTKTTKVTPPSAPLWKLSPYHARKVWGVEKWLFSTHPHGQATVASDISPPIPTAQTEETEKNLQLTLLETLKKVQKHYKVPLAHPPILIKIIETQAALSVQVHPDDEYARKHEKSSGKSECWLFLAQRPHAKVIVGLTAAFQQKAISELEQLFTTQSPQAIEPALATLTITPGSALYLPAGTLHALGSGIRLLEIQQSSDITYRLYDYGRKRPMHIKQGLAVLKRTASGHYTPRSAASAIQTPYFSIHHHRLPPHTQQNITFHVPVQAHKATLLILLSGTCTLTTKKTIQTAQNSPLSKNSSAAPTHLRRKNLSDLSAASEDCLYAPFGGDFTLTTHHHPASYVIVHVELKESDWLT